MDVARARGLHRACDHRHGAQWGVAPDLEAAESTIPGMARAIVSFYREQETANDTQKMEDEIS